MVTKVIVAEELQEGKEDPVEDMDQDVEQIEDLAKDMDQAEERIEELKEDLIEDKDPIGEQGEDLTEDMDLAEEEEEEHSQALMIIVRKDIAVSARSEDTIQCYTAQSSQNIFPKVMM